MADAPSPQTSAPRARVTRTLVAGNIIAFALIGWMRISGVTWINAGYGMVPARLSADAAAESNKLFTSLFVHDGFGHLAWNMFFLLLFGRKVERALGPVRYLLVFLLAGAASGLFQYAIGPQATVPLVGSSGAISGILGGFLVLYPGAPVTIFRLTAWKLIGTWFVINLILALASLGGPSSDTAFFAHIGGFIAGLVTIRLVAGTGDRPSRDWTGLGSSQTRVLRPKIFRKEDGPFWHS